MTTSQDGSKSSGPLQVATSQVRTFFATFGVPEELSSDGGPEFTAGCTKDFLSLWGVWHRVSSAHFPQSNRHSGSRSKKGEAAFDVKHRPDGQSKS